MLQMSTASYYTCTHFKRDKNNLTLSYINITEINEKQIVWLLFLVRSFYSSIIFSYSYSCHRAKLMFYFELKIHIIVKHYCARNNK